MNLGDSFPESFREAFAKRNIVPGSVIKAYVSDTNPPKEKRFIIVGFSYDKVAVATVYINSDVNENIFPSLELKALNIPLACAGRDYLDKDSFVDCSRINPKELSWLLEIVNKDPQRVIGQLSETDLKTLTHCIKGALTITPATKKRFGLFL